MAAISASVDTTCIDTIRVLGADIVQKANSGHPGAPMGCAPMAHTLFGKTMRYAPSDPKWPNRDRFVLSNGHSCALLYTMLHLTGYERPTMADLKNFRQLNSVTAGHPENVLLDGVEVSTGPLGQGISNAVGLAIAEKHLGARFNKPGLAPLVVHSTFVICGDGCLQEGVSSEACSLAGHLKLGKLCVLYDDNDITIDGGTNLSFTEDVAKRFEAYGWHVQSVADGNSTDTSALEAAIAAARAVTDKPSLIKVKTIIGLGSARRAHTRCGTLGAEDLAQVKTRYSFDPEAKFVVPPAVSEFYGQMVAGAAHVAEWNSVLAAYGLQIRHQQPSSSVAAAAVLCPLDGRTRFRVTLLAHRPIRLRATTRRTSSTLLLRSCPSWLADQLISRRPIRPISKGVWTFNTARLPAATFASGCVSTAWLPFATGWPPMEVSSRTARPFSRLWGTLSARFA